MTSQGAMYYIPKYYPHVHVLFKSILIEIGLKLRFLDIDNPKLRFLDYVLTPLQLVNKVVGKNHTSQEITEKPKCLDVFTSKYMHIRETQNTKMGKFLFYCKAS